MFAFWYFRHYCYYCSCCCRCCCMLENIMNVRSVWARVPRALLGKLPHTHRHTTTRFHNVHTKCLPLANTLCHWCESARARGCVFGLRGNVQNMEHGKLSQKKESIKKMNALCSCAVFDFEHTLSPVRKAHTPCSWCTLLLCTSYCYTQDVASRQHLYIIRCTSTWSQK